MLILATIWTAVARREFAVVGENNLGCLGMWLVVGTCLLIYLAAFAFFSIPVFPNETAPNVPFISGTIIPPHVASGQPPVLAQPDAVVMLSILGVIGFASRIIIEIVSVGEIVMQYEKPLKILILAAE